MQQIFLCGVDNEFSITTEQDNNTTDIDIYEVNGNYQYDIEGLYSFEDHLSFIDWLSNCINVLSNHFDIIGIADDENTNGLTGKNLSLLNCLYQSIPNETKLNLCPTLVDVVFEGIIRYSNYNFSTTYDLINFLSSCVNLMRAIIANEMSLEFV